MVNRTPAEDRARWERTADRLLAAVRPYATGDHALVQLPGTPSLNGRLSDGLEGFARTFLLAGFRLTGAGGHDPHDLAGWYAAGLAAGTDPHNPGRWPTFTECNQAKVEAASIAIALHETRPWIWDRLDDRVRQRLLEWFAPMVGNAMPGNNWVWFQAVTEAFARTAGGSWRQDDLDRVIALNDGWYAGGGWYSDGLSGGERRNYDHYNGWAMHLYPLWFCRVLGDDAPAGLLDRYRSRLRRFLADQRLLIGANGSPLIQGRSLTYRHAALASLWTGALFDATPLGPGETRAAANRVLDHFERHGATDDRGLLTLGWHRPFRGVLQVYSGPASPYWASKGFMGLALPPGHPVWTALPEPLAVERGDFTRSLAAPGWLVSGTAADGVVRVVNHGGDHTDPARPHADDPCYARFAYSTHTAPETPGDPTAGPDACAGTDPLDNAVVLLDAAGRASHRRPTVRISIDGGTAVSRSRAHWPENATWDPFGGPGTRYVSGPWVTVGSALRGAVEVRAVRVDPVWGEEPGDAGLVLRVGGWAVAMDAAIDPATAVTGGTAEIAGVGGLVSGVTGVGGMPRARVVVSTGDNAIGERSAIPVLETAGPVEPGRVYVALIRLGRDSGVRPGITTRAEGSDLLVDVDWPGGDEETIRLPAP